MGMLKTRGRQYRPTKTELTSAWSRIREAAEAGDLRANALLISLADLYPLPAVLAIGTDSVPPMKPPVSEAD
ncbi:MULTISPECIES: hypothetical protein [unclassified Pseudomonas]|uniref:hypothetical protein n=1 Tax=unclassified Pseudomonas TaxID=196821 RepID=UPI002B22AAE1|nr:MULTISPECIES: hypothetical protein [unclassified Pseudomonas]MEA9976292.1 hypothetical protein [Pseudomonas sp. RTS4]MEB0197624.1 hypothetical protein [Pseudomonas sp. 5S4]MEB0246130.1 hypothetical protein [Pseudomonas sp. 10S5]